MPYDNLLHTMGLNTIFIAMTISDYFKYISKDNFSFNIRFEPDNFFKPYAKLKFLQLQ